MQKIYCILFFIQRGNVLCLILAHLLKGLALSIISKLDRRPYFNASLVIHPLALCKAQAGGKCCSPSYINTIQSSSIIFMILIFNQFAHFCQQQLHLLQTLNSSTGSRKLDLTFIQSHVLSVPTINLQSCFQPTGAQLNPLHFKSTYVVIMDGKSFYLE